METKSKNIILKIVLILIGVGVWTIVLQNAGIIPSRQIVYVKGGFIDANVKGSVDVSGNVSIDNTVDINLQKINGYRDVFFNNPDRGDKHKYYRIPVTTY